MMRRKINDAGLIIRMLILAAWAAALGCTGGTDVGNPEMRTFASDTALQDYLVTQYARSAWPMSRQSFADDTPPGWIGPDTGVETSWDMNTGGLGMDADAPDRVVSGNGCLYVAGKNDVRIISAARPENMRIIGRITVEGRVDALHLNRQRLVVLYTPEGGDGMPWAYDDNRERIGIDAGRPGGLPTGAGLGILVADVRAPDAPVIIKQIHADGYRMASRISGDNLHVAARFLPDLPDLQLWHDGTEKGAEEAAFLNAKSLAGLTIDDLTPSYSAFDGSGDLIAEGRLIATANDYIRPADPGGGAILSVITANLDNPGPDFSSIGLIADIHHVHASSDAFYLLATEHADDTADIYQTRIHRIDIASDTAQYTAHGRVRGRLLDPSAVGQYKEVFRIATITGLFMDSSAAGHVFCLTRQNDALAVIGSMENLFSDRPPGTARFIGSRGFILDAKDINRITIIDLFDPASPKTSGFMESQGPPAGLFPVFDNLLLVITETACGSADGPDPVPGLCLSLFDISDMTAPRLRHTESISGSGADDSAAFRLSASPLFRPDDRLWAIPVTIGYNRQFIDPHVFSGVYIYQLTDSDTLERQGFLELWPGMVGGEDDPPPWIRGVLNDNAVYAVGPDRVIAGGIDRIGGSFEINPQFTLLLRE